MVFKTFNGKLSYSAVSSYILRTVEAWDLNLYTLKVASILVGSLILLYVYYTFYKTSTTKISCLTQHNKGLQKIENNYLSLIRQTSIISHKEMLSELEYVADKCNEKMYALKCIDVVVYCPHLINIRSPSSGFTPFHRICYRGHAGLIDFMLAKGADPFLTTSKGENAFCMAIYHFLNNPEKTDVSCLEILRQTGCHLKLDTEWYDIFIKKALIKKHKKLAEWIVLHCKITPQMILRCSSIPPTNTRNRM